MDAAEPPPRGRDEIVTAALDAAEQLLSEKGPDEVSLRAIAAEANITYSLLNRHLGTKQAIVDAMLARTEQRWRERVEGLDLRSTVLANLGDSPDAGPYLRLLAWSLLAGEGGIAAHEAHSRMHELVPLAEAALSEADGGGERAADETVAIALAVVFGWRFFSPYVVAALNLEPSDADRLHAAVREFLDRTLPG